jgi:hypothetical protein
MDIDSILEGLALQKKASAFIIEDEAMLLQKLAH